MEAPAYVYRDPLLERELSGQDGTAPTEPDGANELRRIRNFKSQNFDIRKGARFQLANVFLMMDQHHILIRGGFGLDKIPRRRHSLPQQSLPGQLVFDRGKDVIAEVEVVLIRIEELHSTGRRMEVQNGGSRGILPHPAIPISLLFRAYSTVTDFARLRGWSTSQPRRTPI